MQLQHENTDFSSHKKRPQSKLTNFVTVSCRLKPILPGETRSHIELNEDNHSISIRDPAKSVAKTFNFDQIFTEDTPQEVFSDCICRPLVDFIKEGGEGGLIFSYGITNSGKTYSILGTAERPGVLLNIIKDLEVEFPAEDIRIMACELYKDEFYSLKTKGLKLNLKESRGIISFAEECSEKITQSNMKELFEEYLRNRNTFSTVNNVVSSRSHAIFKISTSRFSIGVVDLAGSERYPKKNESHDEKETIFINKSLHALKRCITAFEERSKHIPFRQSKLTQALVEYFVPKCRINVIVNVNQDMKCALQNVQVMDYTSKAKSIFENPNSEFSKLVKSSQKKYDSIKNHLSSQKKDFVKSNKKSAFKPVVKVDDDIIEIEEDEDLHHTLAQTFSEPPPGHAPETDSKRQPNIGEDKENIQPNAQAIQLKEQIDVQLKKSILEAERQSSWKKKFDEKFMTEVYDHEDEMNLYLKMDAAIERKKQEQFLDQVVQMKLFDTTVKKQDSEKKTQQQRLSFKPLSMDVAVNTRAQGYFYVDTNEKINCYESANFDLIATALKKRLKAYLDHQSSKRVEPEVSVVVVKNKDFPTQEEYERMFDVDAEIEFYASLERTPEQDLEEISEDDGLNEDSYTTPSKSKQVSNLPEIVSSHKISAQKAEQSKQEASEGDHQPQVSFVKSIVQSGKKFITDMLSAARGTFKKSQKPVGTIRTIQVDEEGSSKKRTALKLSEDEDHEPSAPNAQQQIERFLCHLCQQDRKELVTVETQYDINVRESPYKDPMNIFKPPCFEVEIQTDVLKVEDPVEELERHLLQNPDKKAEFEECIKRYLLQNDQLLQFAAVQAKLREKGPQGQLQAEVQTELQGGQISQEDHLSQKNKYKSKKTKQLKNVENRHKNHGGAKSKQEKPAFNIYSTKKKEFASTKRFDLSKVKSRRTPLKEPMSAIAKHTRAARNRNKSKVIHSLQQ